MEVKRNNSGCMIMWTMKYITFKSKCYVMLRNEKQILYLLSNEPNILFTSLQMTAKSANKAYNNVSFSN